MKFELTAASRNGCCRVSRRLSNGKYDISLLHFKDIKSVNVYSETSVYETLRGEKHEISTWYVDINTLEDLMNLENEVCHDLIVGSEEILIYDDYVE